MSARGPGIFKPRAEVAILLLAAVLLGFPLISGSVLAGHDTQTYLMYASQVAANAREGILLPAWAPDLNGGYGGPGLLFYPPLVHFLHAVPCLGGVPAILSVSVLAAAGFFVSGLSAWGWLRAEERPAALAGALVYMGAPYRLLDVFERSALSEHWAFVFPPLILWAMGVDALGRRRRAALVALGVGGLLLTNLPAAVLYGPFLFAYALVATRCSGHRLAIGAGAALGFGVALFALVPAALASRWVATELLYSSTARALTPSQNSLFGSPSLNPEFHARVSAAAAATLGLGLAAFLLGPRRRRDALFAVAALGAFLVMLRPFGQLWDALPILSRLQFPWRLTGVLTLALAALVASLASGLRPGLLIAGTALASVLIPIRLTAPLRDAGVASSLPAGEELAFPDPKAVLDSAGLARNPWLFNPKLADLGFLPRTLGEPLVREIWAGGPPAVPGLEHGALAAPEGPGPRVSVVERRRLSWTFRVNADRAMPVVFHVIHFPGMSVDLDGRAAASGFDRRTGLLAIRLPEGEHVVTWKWSPFVPLDAARLGSAVFLLVVLGLALAPGRGFRLRPE